MKPTTVLKPQGQRETMNRLFNVVCFFVFFVLFFLKDNTTIHTNIHKNTNLFDS